MRSGSLASATFFVCAARKSSPAALISGWPSATIAAAHNAALIAPGWPIARVATGMPADLGPIESSESVPLSAALSIGTPSTGHGVTAAARVGQHPGHAAYACVNFMPCAAPVDVRRLIAFAPETRRIRPPPVVDQEKPRFGARAAAAAGDRSAHAPRSERRPRRSGLTFIGGGQTWAGTRGTRRHHPRS